MPTLVDVHQSMDVSDASETMSFDNESVHDKDASKLTPHHHHGTAAAADAAAAGSSSQETTNHKSSPSLPSSLGRHSHRSLHDDNAPLGSFETQAQEETSADRTTTNLSETLLSYGSQQQRKSLSGATTPGSSRLSISNHMSLNIPPTPPELSATRSPRISPSSSSSSRPLFEPGPNQQRYYNETARFVKTTIVGFQRRHPGTLRDYKSMSPAEKENVRHDVATLLRRLGIRKHGDTATLRQSNSSTLNERVSQQQQQQQSPSETSLLEARRKLLLDQTLSPLPASPPTEDPAGMMDAEAYEHHEEGSFPVGAAEEDSVVLNNDDDDSASSIEQVRRGHRSMSPVSSPGGDSRLTINPHKRDASCSGKRGADWSRHRYSLSDELNDEDLLSQRLRRLSLSPHNMEPELLPDAFEASQSPIIPRLTCDSSSDEDDFGNRDDMRISLDNSSRANSSVAPRSIASTIGTYGTCHARNPVVGGDVALREGATYHVGKLKVQRPARHQHDRSNNRSKPASPRAIRKRFVSFPDPLDKYPSALGGKLSDVCKWFLESESDYASGRSGVATSAAIFSISSDQVIHLAMKLILDDCQQQEATASRQRPSQKQQPVLVVCRHKDDMALWESSLRNGTGCSVLNHACLPLSERIRCATADKAALYDVVLSTYDAMKSPDHVVAVNELGHAIHDGGRGEGAGGGWLTSRNSQQVGATGTQQCKQFSVLHRIMFKRVVFMDVLGRKSYLAKQGTARAAAAVALGAQSRLVFFADDTGGTSASSNMTPLVALRKCDRRAARSLANILHIETEMDDADEDEDEQHDLENYLLDLNDIAK